MSPFVQNLFAQEELEGHPSDVLLLIFGRPWWILSVLDEALDIVIPRLVVYRNTTHTQYAGISRVSIRNGRTSSPSTSLIKLASVASASAK